jgi:hypothetical protein
VIYFIEQNRTERCSRIESGIFLKQMTGAGVPVEDLAFLSDKENNYKNAARLMKKRLRAAVHDCRAVYFDHCTMLFPGRVDGSLTPEHRRKTAEEKEKEQAEACDRGRGHTSSDSWASFRQALSYQILRDCPTARPWLRGR